MREKRFNKLQSLQLAGHARDEELETARSELVIARSNFLTAKEDRRVYELEVERIKAQIERLRIHSPIDGVVSRIYKEVAELTGGANDQIITLVQLDPLKLILHVSTTHALKMKIGDEILLRIETLEKKQMATIDTVAPVIDAESGTVRITIRLDNKYNIVRSGMRVHAEIDGI